MACKTITAVAGAILLGSATIASAHAPDFPQLSHAHRHFRHSPRLSYYGYHGHVPIFPPAIASGYAPLGVTAGAVASGYAPLVPYFTEARVSQFLGFRSQMNHLPSISGGSRSSDSGY